MERQRQEILKELCDMVVATSLYWTGEDEEKNPLLKRVRTLAKYHLEGGCGTNM